MDKKIKLRIIGAGGIGKLLYKKTLELAQYLVNESKGDFFVSMPDTAGNADALAHLRGSGELLIDFLEEEDYVRSSLQRIQDVWLKVNQEIYDITRENNDGGTCIGWLNSWALGKHAQMQSDISVMISPDTFRNLIMPELRAQSGWMDYPLYLLLRANSQEEADDMIKRVEKLTHE